MTKWYIREGHKPKPIANYMEAARWFETADRRVAKAFKIGEATVSTVFLAIDHQFGDGPPLLFETMVFGGIHDGYQKRYTTWEEAEKGHAKAVALVKAG